MVQRSFSSPHKAISEAAHDSCSQIADVWELGAVHPQHDVLFSGCLFSIVFRVLVSKEASAFHKKENSKIWEKLEGEYTIQQRLKKFYNRLEQKFVNYVWIHLLYFWVAESPLYRRICFIQGEQITVRWFNQTDGCSGLKLWGGDLRSYSFSFGIKK